MPDCNPGLTGSTPVTSSNFEPLRVAEDRSILVPAGKRVVTGYAHVNQIHMVNRDRMGIGDVERAMQKQMAASPGQPWPCPNGFWEDGAFKLKDGRHAYVAALMLGVEYLLVAWIED